MRAGEMPSAAAAAWSDVVLNGAGGRWVRLLRSTSLTRPSLAPSTWAKAERAACSSQKRAVACVTRNGPAGSPGFSACPWMTQ